MNQRESENQAFDLNVEPQRHIGFLMRRVQQRHLASWLNEVSTEITGVQYSVMAVLDRRPRISQRELGDELDLERATINDVVSRLEKRGWLRRTGDAIDRRRKVLELTAAGEHELAALRPAVERLQSVLVEPLAAAEVDTLRGLLTRLVR